jgi:uncharacterized protein
LALAALFALAMPWHSRADAPKPSFECTAAKVPIEILICSETLLANADRALADAYGRVAGSLQGAAHDKLLGEQRAWLKSRLTTCSIPSTGKTLPADRDQAVLCLYTAYLDRIDMLAKLAPRLPSAPVEVETSAPVVAVEGQLPTALGLDKNTLPATGDQHSILSVAQFGRYAVTVKSGQGVALQLVDRMAGPGAIEGVAGESDGRVDAFLDRGLYKILLHADAQGSGDAALTVHPFAELNAPEIPRLPEIKRIDTDLGDFQQRSYWLEIKDRQTVAIEAAGRNLTEMRLWRDGNWLVDATPTSDQVEPKPGEPLAVRRIVTTLEPGLYLLSTYGGPELPWAKTSDAHPLHVQMGIPRLGDAGRQAFIAGRTGIDRFLVHASASYFRIELPEAEAAELYVDDYSEQQPFGHGSGVAVTKKSVPPIAEISTSSSDHGYKLVTIRREAGKPYVLQHFQSVDRYTFKGDGDYWIATLHSGYGEDSVDATGLLTKYGPNTNEEIIADNAIKLDPKSAWSAQFNLLGTFTLYVHVTQAGNYIVTQKGAVGEYRFEPMVHFPENYRTPDFQPARHVWQLDPGYYVLTGRPMSEGKGIVSLQVGGLGALPAEAPRQTSVLFPKQRLTGAFLNYTLYLNTQPGVEAGVVLRKLPINLIAGLPLVLKAGQTLKIPVTAPDDGTITAIAEDASALSFSIDGAAAVTEWRGNRAQHVLTIANPTDKALNASLRYTPDSLAPTTPLPKVSAEALAAIPTFPPLLPQQTTYFDIAKTEQRTFALDVAEPGLYRVESSGLLQTEGNMRTRTVISLDRQSNNGTGRNFLLQQYLGQGSYQVSVESQGETHGRLGVSAARTLMMDGGALPLGVPARDTIAAGNGLVYTFNIDEAGQYRLRALGLGRTYTMRLEDADGWPIIPPNAPAELTMDFKPGGYRLVILPQPVEAKIVTLLERIEEPAAVEGHGPHDLVLNQPQSFQWREPEAGAERVPDQWRFKLPATTHVAIDLSQGMRADLVGEDGKTRNAVIGGDNWQAELPSGTYTLRATTFEPNNRFDYTISVTATELVGGRSLVTNLPADIPVSIGSDSVVEIGSFGTTDVRAWLYDADNRLAATNDDRPNDWNFAVAGRLQPGYYRLHLEAVGKVPDAPEPAVTDTVEDGENDQMVSGDAEGEGEEEAAEAPAEAAPGQTTVSIYQPEEQIEQALAVGKDTELSGPKVHIVPLTAAPGNAPIYPSQGDALVASADASGPAVGLGLERQENGHWVTLSESIGRSPWVALPMRDRDGKYRLRIWSVDRSSDPIRLQTRMVTQKPMEPKDFGGSGVALAPVPGLEPPLAMAAVLTREAGGLKLEQAPAGLEWSTEAGNALAGDASNIVFGKSWILWLGARTGERAIVKASKLVPGEAPIAFTVRGSFADATIITDPVAVNREPQIWLAESRLGQPGIYANSETDAPYSGFAEGSAIAVNIGAGQKGFRLELWNAGDSTSPLPVTLRRIAFTKLETRSVDSGATNLHLGARQAIFLNTWVGMKRVQLALPPQTAVVLRHNSASETIWSGDRALAITVNTENDQLVVLSAGSKEAQIGIVITPVDQSGQTKVASNDAAPKLGGGGLFRQYFASEGVVRVPVVLSENEKAAAQAGRMPLLRAEGAVKGITLIRDDGTVSRDGSSKVGATAIVDIAHGVGPVLAWLDGGDPLTSLGVAAKGIQVKSTSIVKIEGEAQQVVFSVDAPKLLRFKTTAPVITQVDRAEGPQNLHLFDNGADLSLYLPKGTTPLVLRAAADGSLAGVAEATLIDVTAIGEGLGPKVRLAPGESRLYSFTVKDERDIGVGVRGSTDSARCRVLDAEGNAVGSGVVQMLHLKAGTYLLAVDAPAEGNAIEVQPALVGIAAPDGSPPDDVKRGYLELAGLKPKTQE